MDAASAERIFRRAALMVTAHQGQIGPRDIKMLSTQVHNRFEQGAPCLECAVAHHLRCR
ncbi:MAG: phage FluMu protein gp41 [Paracoccaceae bacterium]|jgi:phage FluMu protein gp41